MVFKIWGNPHELVLVTQSRDKNHIDYKLVARDKFNNDIWLADYRINYMTRETRIMHVVRKHQKELLKQGIFKKQGSKFLWKKDPQDITKQ